MFFTNDGGKKWAQLKGGLPTIQVRDIAIQRRENDLVLATFGRGFYVLDDYSPLRAMNEQTIVQAGGPVDGGQVDRSTVDATERSSDALPRQGCATLRGIDSARTSRCVVPGTELLHGAEPAVRRDVHLLSERRDRVAQAQRQKAEAALAKKNADVFYPPWDSLKAEDRAEDPAVVVTVSDASGQVVRRFTAPTSAGINRVAWDLRLQPTDPVNGPPFKPDPDFPFTSPPLAPFAPPGTYQVALAKRVDGVFTPLGTPQRFQVVDVDSVPGRVMATIAEQRKVAELERSVLGTSALVRRDAASRRLPQARDRRDAVRRHVARASCASSRAAAPGRTGIAHRRSDARAAAGSHDAIAPRPAAGRDRQLVEELALRVESVADARQIDLVRREFGAVLVARASARRRRAQGSRGCRRGGGRAVDERPSPAAAAR